MDEYEKNNVISMFTASLDGIFKEKLAEPKWHDGMEKFSARVNFRLVTGSDDEVYVYLIAKDGKFTVEPGKLADSNFELAASFEIYFNISIGSADATKALFKGALKAKHGFKNIKKLLYLQKLLILEKK
nr:SCP2 sterol-binding domain-containing protein [Candidatus Sigynarchaeota archaeon]